MTSRLPKVSVAEMLAEKIIALKPGMLPAVTIRKCEDLLIDVVGLCVTARNEDYVASALAAVDDDGSCTAIGHERTLNAVDAALVNGSSGHPTATPQNSLCPICWRPVSCMAASGLPPLLKARSRIRACLRSPPR